MNPSGFWSVVGMRMRIVKGSTVLGLVAASGASYAWAPPIMDWLDKAILKRIQITGRRTLGVHMHSVTGDLEAFNSLNYYGQGASRFTDTGNITLVGDKVLGVLNFNMTLTDSRFNDPQSKRIWLDYKKDGFQLGYGDLMSASLLNTNDFARYTKTLSGATVGYNKGRFAFKALRTESKSSARTRSLQGANSTGPYFLGDAQIVNDSEEIKVDGVEMRQGQDYTINYQSGAITFVNRVIPPTSTILASYETLGFNNTPGIVQGAGMSYDMGKFGRVGLTAVEQRAGGSTGLNSRTDRFQGYESTTSPYILDFEPLPSRPIVVKVNGILQIQNVDYIFGKDAAGNTIYSIIFFLRPVPAINEVSVTYTPKPTQTIDGDRRVWGFDYRLPLGNKHGFIQYSQAMGELQNGVNPLSGTARGIKGEYRFGDYRLRASLKDVPDDFVGVESRGFNRNERAADVGLEFRHKAWSWGVSGIDSTINYRTPLPNGTTQVRESNFANQRAFVAFSPQPGDFPGTWSTTGPKAPTSTKIPRSTPPRSPPRKALAGSTPGSASSTKPESVRSPTAPTAIRGASASTPSGSTPTTPPETGGSSAPAPASAKPVLTASSARATTSPSTPATDPAADPSTLKPSTASPTAAPSPRWATSKTAPASATAADTAAEWWAAGSSTVPATTASSSSPPTTASTAASPSTAASTNPATPESTTPTPRPPLTGSG